MTNTTQPALTDISAAMKVYGALTERERSRTSAGNVVDVLRALSTLPAAAQPTDPLTELAMLRGARYDETIGITATLRNDRIAELERELGQEEAPPAAQPVALSYEEMQALRRFWETCEDGQEYDVPRPMMRQLAERGAVRWHGGSRFAFTDFGLWLLSAAPAAQPELTGEQWSAGRAAFVRWAKEYEDALSSEVANMVADGAPIAIHEAIAATPPAPAAPQGQQPAPSIPAGWISVEDRLPEPETAVLILMRGEYFVAALHWEKPTFEETFQAYRYWDSPDSLGLVIDWHDVTHWMPLPELPAAPSAGERP